MNVALWPLRWELRIGRRTSDERLTAAVNNFGWRMRASGMDPGEVLQMLLDAGVARNKLRELLLDAADQRVPDGWWGEEGENP